MLVIDEGSEHTMRFDSFANVDAEGNPITPIVPATASYSVRDKLTGTLTKTNVTLTPAASITIVFDAADSGIVNSTLPYEDKVATLKTAGCNKEYTWRVNNLGGV